VVGEPVVLVNRTSEPLQFTADGRHYVLKPGSNYGFVQGHTRFALAQNPLMGSENYYTLDYVSKVGVEGMAEWPTTPISDEDLLKAMDTFERLDRAGSDLAVKIAVKAKHGRSGRMASMANDNAMAIGSGA
jgi:hypothetical protein